LLNSTGGRSGLGKLGSGSLYRAAVGRFLRPYFRDKHGLVKSIYFIVFYAIV